MDALDEKNQYVLLLPLKRTEIIRYPVLSPVNIPTQLSRPQCETKCKIKWLHNNNNNNKFKLLTYIQENLDDK